MKQTAKVFLFLLTLIGSILLLPRIGLSYNSLSITALTSDPYAPPTGVLTGQVTFEETGAPISNVSVHIYKSTGGFEKTVLTDAAGMYMAANLSEGSHTVYFQGLTPAGNYDWKEATVYINVKQSTTLNSILTAPHLPLALTPDTGGSAVYTDPVTGEVWLNQPQAAIVLAVPVTCDGGAMPTAVTLTYNGQAYPMSDSNGDGTYEVTIPFSDIPDPNNPPMGYDNTLSVSKVCAGNTTNQIVAHVTLYDPSGLITSSLTGQPLIGAAVTLFHMPGLSPDTGTSTDGDCRTINSRPTGENGDWSGLPAADINRGAFAITSSGLIDPQVNPQLTADNGRYGWDVAAGCWYVTVSAPGHVTIVSPAVGVPPEVTDLDLVLAPNIPTATGVQSAETHLTSPLWIILIVLTLLISSVIISIKVMVFKQRDR